MIYKNGSSNDESAAKKWKLETLKVKFKSNINGVIKEIADCGEVNIAAIPDTQMCNQKNSVKIFLSNM